MISLTIDNRKIEVEEGLNVLQAAGKLGIKIPTLCYHESLKPYGACRVCLVELIWPRSSNIQASCVFPVQEGLVVRTNTERVLKTRRMMLELLLARCPDVPRIKEMAREMGVKESRFTKKNDGCILCGLCTRVCQERMGVGAINFINRGSDRKISPPYDKYSEICITCGACKVVCPTDAVDLSKVTLNKPKSIKSEFDANLAQRSSIYIPYPQAVPKVPVIDRHTCMYFLKDVCKSCENFCEAKAINYDQKDETKELDVGAVILSPGFELFDANLKQEFGFGRYPNVISSLQFERVLSASGPYLGQILRSSDQKHPRKIAFIQCVGSREVDRNYCSSVCCMYATKEAIIAKEHEPDLECHIFYIDLRAFGKGFEQYYERAKELGVKYTRCRPSAVREVPATKNLILSYYPDDSEEKKDEEFDMVVLSCGLNPPAGARDMAKLFNVELNKDGFCRTGKFTPVETSRSGIYACGPFVEPKDIPETVMEASGAASKAMGLLTEARGTLVAKREYPAEKKVEGEEPRVGVFVCHCGKNIGGIADVPSIRDYAKSLPNVVYTEDNLYTCSSDTQKKIKDMIKEHNLNRVVVASCTPRTHEALFRNTCREAGLNPYLFEMANIRDHNTWVHMKEPEKATAKAKDLVRIAVAKARVLEPLQNRFLKIVHDALVIGGGLSGMSAALDLANQGFTTHLVERTGELGGNMKHIYYLVDEKYEPQKELLSIIEQVRNHSHIKLYLSSNVKTIEGSMGNFKTTVETQGGDVEFKHGTVIVATGAEEYKPKEYLYGQDSMVITQVQFEEKIARQLLSKSPGSNPSSKKQELVATSLPAGQVGNPDLGSVNSVTMIQCVGSRDKEHPYCSRICCSMAVKNAMKFKKLKPAADVYVLYRDIRTYGFNEVYYRQAREAGVIFLRYKDDEKPEVARTNGKLTVTMNDPILRKKIALNTDLVVLSAGTAPIPGNEELAKKLKVPLNQDKFFLEAHMKLRPVDFSTDGVYLSGLAHSPKNVDESIVQSCGAASRAATILAQDIIELDAIVSEVIDANCDGCAYCIDPCPYHALILTEYMKEGSIKKTVERDLALCKGCGVCQATCPKAGIVVNNFKLSQLMEMVNATLEPQE